MVQQVRKRRRAPTWRERRTPCSCCGWPLSQRHHLLEIAQYGENTQTEQLCANCHELYHVMRSAWEWEHTFHNDLFTNRYLLLERQVVSDLWRQGRAEVVGKVRLLLDRAQALQED